MLQPYFRNFEYLRTTGFDYTIISGQEVNVIAKEYEANLVLG